MKKVLTSLLLLSAFFFSCNQKLEQRKAIKSIESEMDEESIPDNSFNALDWTGFYSGNMPNANGEVEEVGIEISKNMTYTLVRKKVGMKSAETSIKGTFEWDKTGSKIFLNASGEKLGFLVGEEALFPLDKNGERFKDKASQYFQLRKKPNEGNSSGSFSNKPITETKWLLVELMGKPVEKSKNFYLILSAEDNRLSAFAGCNQMAGSYEITEKNSIQFRQLISTKMACAEMEFEDRLSVVLKKSNRYVLKSNTLSLFGGEISPLARFEAE